jgi:hypothetical protein
MITKIIGRIKSNNNNNYYYILCSQRWRKSLRLRIVQRESEKNNKRTRGH